MEVWLGVVLEKTIHFALIVWLHMSKEQCQGTGLETKCIRDVHGYHVVPAKSQMTKIVPETLSTSHLQQIVGEQVGVNGWALPFQDWQTTLVRYV